MCNHSIYILYSRSRKDFLLLRQVVNLKRQPPPRILLSTVPLDNQLRAKVGDHSIYIFYSRSSRDLKELYNLPNK